VKINIILGHAFPVPPGRAVAIGAVESRCWEIGNAMAGQGHDVVVYSRRCERQARAEIFVNGLRVVGLRGHDWTRKRRRDLRNAFWYSLRLASAVRDADVHVCKTFFFPFVAGVLRRPRGVVWVGLHREPRAHLRAYWPLLRDGGSGRFRFTAVSGFVKREAERICPAMKGAVAVIPNPVDVHTFRPGPQKWAVPAVLYVGRIVKEKGLEYLAEAFARMKQVCSEARLRIVGPLLPSQNSDGAFACELRRRFEAYPWSADVSFLGFKAGELLLEEYQKAWIVCCPSVAGEACCNVVTEAMACGTPIVTTSFGPFPEQFTDGREGFQVPPRNAGALADALLCLIRNDSLRRSFGCAARERAQQYSLSRIVDLYLNAFQKSL